MKFYHFDITTYTRNDKNIFKISIRPKYNVYRCIQGKRYRYRINLEDRGILITKTSQYFRKSEIVHVH